MMRAIPATPKSASINRIRIAELPGLELDDAVRGEQAYHLLSAPALIHYAQARGNALGLPPRLRQGHPEDPEIRRDLPRYVDTCLSSDDPGIREAAKAIARRLGRNLGFILLTLHRGDPVNRAARADWTQEAWAAWGAVRRVWLGGGIVSGDLGQALIDHAQALLKTSGYGEISVARTPYPKDMALLGAGRYLPHPAGGGGAARWHHALCLDLGQTSIKRAVATVNRSGVLTDLRPLPSVPVPWRWQNNPDAAGDIDGRAVLDVVSRAVATGLEESKKVAGEEVVSRDVAMSIAAYVREGVLFGNGIYARMSRLSRDARTLIAHHVAHRSADIPARRAPRLHIIHDGTAAAALHAGEPHGAVIVVGTALGVGFPPPDATGLREIADAL
jgi:hypothetical protein